MGVATINIRLQFHTSILETPPTLDKNYHSTTPTKRKPTEANQGGNPS